MLHERGAKPMRFFKRGGTGPYWYEFVFRTVRIQESSNSTNKEVAERIAREHRRKLELGTAGLKEVAKPVLFSVAAREWFQQKRADWTDNTARIETTNLSRLLPHFGKLMMMETDMTSDQINLYKGKRKAEKASPKTINLELATLRAILRKYRMWENVKPDVKMLKVREDVGRRLTPDEMHRLFIACRNNRSRSLYPAFLLSIHTGLRNEELRLLKWRQIDLIEEKLTVGKSKTIGGEGREVNLSKTAVACLKEWRSQFPNAHTNHYVFPSERYGLKGGEGESGHFGGKVAPYNVRPTVPIGSWKTAWTTAREAAGVQCRWHDARHTFISILADGGTPDQTIMALAGHVSRNMMKKYSHTENASKRAAVAVFDGPLKPNSNHAGPGESLQIPLQ
jgi:integrase